MDYRKYRSKRVWMHLISAPFIWLPLPFMIMLDIAAEIYQLICFPIYHLKPVRRAQYIQIFDRSRLQYLDGLEKLGCMYCGYANGLFLYLKEVAGQTERYWCGIKHQNQPGFHPHLDQSERGFVEYGDRRSFEQKYPLDKN